MGTRLSKLAYHHALSVSDLFIFITAHQLNKINNSGVVRANIEQDAAIQNLKID